MATSDFTNPNALTLTGGTIDYSNPDWYNQYLQNVASTGNTFTADKNTPGSIAYNTNNWYSAPLTGDWNTSLQQGTAGAQAGGAPGGYLTQAGNAITGAATYDPTKLNQFLNPYTKDAAAATTNLSNKNLFENVLPGVNSTFTGAGQFGSSRNADFENRAIRDQQQTLTNSLGTLNYGAVNNAQAAMSDWANKGITAGMDTAQLGTQNLANLNTAGKGYLDWQNAGLGANYQDYLKQLDYPTQAMGALTQLTGALKGSTTPSQTLTPGEMSGPQKAAILASMVGQLGNGSTLDDIKALWDSLGLG